MMATALKSWEEVVEQDALAWLHLSSLTLGSLLLSVE